MVADAASGGVRLAMPVQAGRFLDEISIEPAHCERLFRMTTYLAILDAELAPTARVAARIVPGRIRDRHGSVSCLETSAVELVDELGTVVARREFPRATFAAFAMARGLNLLLAAGGEALASASIVYSLHASEGGDEPFPVAIPTLAELSIDRLTARSSVEGEPHEGWVATFLRPQVVEGLRELEHLSRASGLETAGRIWARTGFDPDRKRFVRVLDRLVVSRATRATASTILSTGASWGEFLSATESEGPQAYASAHTHLHLDPHETQAGRASGTRPELTEPSSSQQEPIISIDDVVTHYTAFPDPLSAALIVSLFPDRRVVTVYGYAADARLVEEPGYWVLHDD